MIDAGVSMTSTLAVYELFVPGRPTRDARSLEAMAPEVREAYLADRARIDTARNPSVTLEAFRNAMAYERRFVEMGGLLANGVDPRETGARFPATGTSGAWSSSRKRGSASRRRSGSRA